MQAGHNFFGESCSDSEMSDDHGACASDPSCLCSGNILGHSPVFVDLSALVVGAPSAACGMLL